ncbi:TPA: hypothetical protein ACGW1T_000378 [Raoultella ornithinolytica]
MTTDITELAQSLKTAAVRAKTATEEYASGHMSVSVCYAECEEFNRLTDGPDNILALVEALEKAQTDGNEYASSERAVAVKSVELQDEIYGLKARIAELESKNTIANEKVCELSRLVQHNMSRAEDAERRAKRLSSSSPLHPGLLYATNELVLMFSYALADKLYAAQEKYNHGTSWRNADWEEACQRDFQKHIAKGDPRDVAAYCAFMWWHGWSTKPAEALESRTVKMPEPFKLAKSSSGLTYYYADEVNEALSAAGIKWEAE